MRRLQCRYRTRCTRPCNCPMSSNPVPLLYWHGGRVCIASEGQSIERRCRPCSSRGERQIKVKGHSPPPPPPSSPSASAFLWYSVVRPHTVVPLAVAGQRQFSWRAMCKGFFSSRRALAAWGERKGQKSNLYAVFVPPPSPCPAFLICRDASLGFDLDIVLGAQTLFLKTLLVLK